MKSRQIKNNLAKWMISAGGVSVLFTLVLIFLYLVYVVKPVFESASVEPLQKVSSTTTNVLAAGVDELREIAFDIDNQGVIRFFQIEEDGSRQANQLLLEQDLLVSGETLASVQSMNDGNYLLLLDNGTVRLFRPKFSAEFIGDTRVIHPSIEYPLGEEAIIVDEDEQTLSQLSFAMDAERATFIALTADDRLIKTSLIAEDDFSWDPEYSAEYQLVKDNVENIKFVGITPDMTTAFVVAGESVDVYDFEDDWDVPKRADFEPVANSNNQITSMALLSGSSSVLIGTSDGQVHQYFEVAAKDGRQFKRIRSFTVSESEAVVAIYPELYRKSFFAATESGMVGIYYTTSESELWTGKLLDNGKQLLTIMPRANGLVVAATDGIELINVDNEHPEVTWSALWQEVWYEGYPEPDFIWQSTSGSDDFEAKFSLMPISFGTMKAAFYAMLFAVPIAISAAIYTAYFMPPVMRRTVKPTIELMEALPTVILGFLAGLWLAPLIEEHLPAVFMLVITLPVTTVVVAYVWYNLPKQIKAMIPETYSPLILLPFLIFAGWLSFALSPVVEASMFGGDMRQYLTNDLGINFDQRNSLIVGIAMGFAVIPTIFSMAEDAIFSVPKHLTSGSLALGATQWQTLIKVVLLTASPGIFSAVMMGLGRAVGETMIVLMATGNTPVIDWSIFQGMRTLSANIAVEMPESEVGSSHYRILFLAAFVLFVFTFVFNTLAEFVRQRLREKYSSL
ncbi:ABC transporter permease subunit [Thalassotalea sp. HSM 43]|uniref:ABC transporter permease subunit n=1 Tax=Thalassotalea sp. HSM 43 TaxID=2552945 RepID=UPI0010815F9C|nr:ABC transporter permease subunit [Thalassotalea sp. HSM 43]QBY03468.1 ABC transporter permease subunit [Thalassotalea sp. HSM 43]